jgi:hypothetical protein
LRAESVRIRAGRGGAGIPAADKIHRKLKRLRQIEAGYRSQIRRAQQALKDTTVDRAKAERKFEKIRAKIEGKIEKVQPKIRELTNLKAERRS